MRFRYTVARHVNGTGGNDGDGDHDRSDRGRYGPRGAARRPRARRHRRRGGPPARERRGAAGPFRARASVDALRDRFETARPFPHVVIDGLFDATFLRGLVDDFGGVGFGDWLRYDNASERKRATRPGAKLGPASQAYIDVVHRGPFNRFLSDITGIDGLLPDPTLHGGGLHEIPPGGKFAVHVDFNKHPVTRLDTRLVLITYLNDDWQPSYGGARELWNADTDRCEAQVVPVFGRSILFAHTATSLHGHPDPVRAPNGRPRRSSATYFYTTGRPDADGGDVHTTRLHRPLDIGRWGRAANTAKYFIPPALVDGARRLRTRL